MTCPSQYNRLAIVSLLLFHLTLTIVSRVHTHKPDHCDTDDDCEVEQQLNLNSHDRATFLRLKEESKDIDYARIYNFTKGPDGDLNATTEVHGNRFFFTKTKGLLFKHAPLSIKSSRYEADEVFNKNPEQLIKLRGFESQTHHVQTKDGYYIHLVRLINPKLSADKKNKRPVIFNHGLFESATLWLVNSRDMAPSNYTQTCGGPVKFGHGSKPGSQYRNGPMMLANAGYDVWLMSMRGTDYSLKHDKYDSKDPKFWHYSLDHFGLIDVPSVVNYVRKQTKINQVAYIGHSQATFAIFALLSTKPEFAKVIEPVIAIAPVSHFQYVTSASKSLLKAAKLVLNFSKDGPFPAEAPFFRKFNYATCNNALISTFACQLANALISGSGEYWPKGYYSHIPFFTSYQVIRHFDQLMNTNEFKMYDYGDKNMKVYKSAKAPVYELGKIESKSMYLFSAEQDLLSAPRDVEYIARNLKYPPKDNIVIGGKYNHFDLVTGEKSGVLVFEPILKMLEEFTNAKLNCSNS